MAANVIIAQQLFAALGRLAAGEQAQVNGRERQLLYVAMTRARDELVVSWSGEPSPFIAPLMGGPPGETGQAGAALTA